MRTIDLNADLGEGGLHDAELISLASSANIACGGHAGDDMTMRRAILACLSNKVAIGAHPGYEDPENFGRRALQQTPAEVARSIQRQLQRIINIAQDLGAEIHHVKPHGALYNQANCDPQLARAIASTVGEMLPSIAFYVPPGGALAAAGELAQLRIRAEGFVDRLYQADGNLTPRSTPGAVIEDLHVAISQALNIAIHHVTTTSSGVVISLRADTLCVHGDGLHAIELLRAVRHALLEAGFQIHSQKEELRLPIHNPDGTPTT